MNSLTTSIILLIIAVVLLWMAVTDRLGRVIDAYDVITGKSTASTSSVAATPPLVNPAAFKLPSLPTIGINAQVAI